MEQTSKEVVLTYETLYEFLRKEKSREELQKLGESFLKDTLNYSREKQQAYDDNLTKNDIFSQSERDKLHIQISNIRKILKDLYDVRERKIVNMAINKNRANTQVIDTGNLLSQEQAMFGSLHAVLSQYRTGILHRMLELREPDVLPIVLPLPSEETSKEEIPAPLPHGIKKIKCLDTIEQIFDEDLESYGPFQVEQEIELPGVLADILVSQGKAVELQ
jgi:DNA replication initiation complex subunit (GINS family)